MMKHWLTTVTLLTATPLTAQATARAQTPEAAPAPPADASVPPQLPPVGEAAPPQPIDARETSDAKGVGDSDLSKPTASPPIGVVVDAGARGFGFTSPDGRDSLFIHWLVQADYYSFVGQVPPGAPVRDTFTMGFAGLQLDANLSGIWHSSILVDFSQSRLTLLDAFLEARFHPAFVLRMGKFETPLTEERLTPKFLLPWISTNPASFLLPVREVGVQLLGDIGHGVVQYNAAVVNGSYAGAITDNDLDSFKDVMGRVYVHPFEPTRIAALEKLGFGVGASLGNREGNPANPETPVLRTYGNATFFSYQDSGVAAGTVVASGTVARISPEVTYAWGPVAAFADYVREIDHFGATSVTSDAWGATATVALTGEDAGPFSRILVKRPWDPARGHFGGVQLVAGGGYVHVSDDAFRAKLATATSMQEADILGAGINWYPINGFGLLVDYSYTAFHSYGGTPARPDENTIYGRAEFHM
jgi:phosphate-selective porin OprO/OprP